MYKLSQFFVTIEVYIFKQNLRHKHNSKFSFFRRRTIEWTPIENVVILQSTEFSIEALQCQQSMFQQILLYEFSVLIGCLLLGRWKDTSKYFWLYLWYLTELDIVVQ